MCQSPVLHEPSAAIVIPKEVFIKGRITPGTSISSHMLVRTSLIFWISV